MREFEDKQLKNIERKKQKSNVSFVIWYFDIQGRKETEEWQLQKERK